MMQPLGLPPAAHRGLILSAGRSAAALLLASCVSMDADDTDGPRTCTAALASVDTTVEAAVVLESDIGVGFLRCSAVAIAPTLVVTSLACVVRPAIAGDRDPAQLPAPSLYDAQSALGGACDSARGWATREDGTFIGELGQPIPSEAMEVFLAADPSRSSGVSSIHRSGAPSRCAAGLAVLELARDIGALPAPVRLEEPTHIEESVLISGHCVQNGKLDRRMADSIVHSRTYSGGDEMAPPHSLTVDGGSLATDFGGAILSRDSGALIGVISSGLGRRCDQVDRSVTTTAVRVAAFRKMLLSVAGQLSIELQAESSPAGTNQGRMRQCSSRPYP